MIAFAGGGRSMTEVQVTETIQFAEDAARHLRGPGATQWRERLEGRYDECQAALRWLVDNERTEEALRLVLALVDFWQYTDRISDGRKWLQRVLLARTIEDALRAEALFEAGLFAFWQGDDETARALHQRSLELARRLDLSDSAALVLTGLARIELRTDVHGARGLCLEALETVEANESRGRSSALHVLGVAAQMSGDYTQARDWMSQRLDLAEKMGDLRLVAAEAGNFNRRRVETGLPGASQRAS
jgi:tetratricopeptide (TPR) repeat protein